MDAKEYLRLQQIISESEWSSEDIRLIKDASLERSQRQQKIRKIKNWIVIFIVAAVFLLFSYGVFGLIVDVLPQMVK